MSYVNPQMVNNDMGAGGVQLPMSGIVPLAEPPPKRQKTVNLQVTTARNSCRQHVKQEEPGVLCCSFVFASCDGVSR